MSGNLQFAVDVARRTGEILKRDFKKERLETRIKGDKTIVTEADLNAERLIKDEIRNQYPLDKILSEEQEGVFSYREGQNVWIIDPLDGTTNFNLGVHIWGVLLTHIADGYPATTVMYFPQLDEIYTAEIGKGAYLNGKRIQVELPNRHRPLSFFACCSRTFHNYSVSVPYKVRILGSAAYSFCALSRGTALVAFEATPKIWDIAGAWLLVREAGGAMITQDGSVPFPLGSGLDYTGLNFPMLAAANEELLNRSKGQIRKRTSPTA